MMQNLETYYVYYYYKPIFSILIQTSEKDTPNHLLEFEIK